MKDISIQKNILPELALTGFRTTWARFQTIRKNTIKKRITTTLNSYYYKKNKNNKYQQGGMNICEDITIEKSNKTNKSIFTVTKNLNLRYLKLI